MTVKSCFIAMVALLKMTNSQYYSQPSSYQLFGYPSPTPLVSPSMYATPPAIPITYPPMFVPPPVFVTPSTYVPANQPISTLAPGSSALTYAPTFATPTVSNIPMYPPPTTFTTTPIKSPFYANPTNPLSLPPTTVSIKPSLAAPRCTPATATAYYLTSSELPKPREVILKKDNEKENKVQGVPPPTYPCPFCTGFANVPKSSKISPPPPCSSVLPGILDKIPTIAIPDELKIKELCKVGPLSDLFQHKLSGKLRFDQDLLDGFLTGLGLGKIDDL